MRVESKTHIHTPSKSRVQRLHTSPEIIKLIKSIGYFEALWTKRKEHQGKETLFVLRSNADMLLSFSYAIVQVFLLNVLVCLNRGLWGHTVLSKEKNNIYVLSPFSSCVDILYDDVCAHCYCFMEKAGTEKDSLQTYRHF